MLHATASVLTDSPGRYAKQLLSHLGRKIPMEALDGEPGAGRLVFAYGSGVVRPLSGTLLLEALAEDEESLNRLQDVLTRHLVRFGRRNELVVTWQRRS